MNGVSIVTALVAALPDEALKKVADAAIDAAENLIEKTPTHIDDMIVLPLINKVRDVFDIPDNDKAKA